jgi:hypothetical protein
MGSLDYQDFYEKDVFLTPENLEFTHTDQPSLRINPVWDHPNSHFTIRVDGASSETQIGAMFVRTNEVRVDHLNSDTEGNPVHVQSGLSVVGTFQSESASVTSNKPYTVLSDNELVSKKQMSDYLLNYLTTDVQFNDTTLINLIEDALLNITLPDVQTEKILQVLDEYRSNGNMESDITQAVYTMTVDQDTSRLITSNVLDVILQDYIQQSFIPNLDRLNIECSRLFDYPMEPFYLRLEDYVSNYVIKNVPSLVNASNIVYLDYLQENFYTKAEIREGGIGTGGGDAGNINTDHLLTKLDASEIYVKKSDFFTADGNVQLNYTVDSNINVYKYEVQDIKTFVDVATTDTSGYRYTVESANRIVLSGLEAHTIDHTVLIVNDRVLLHSPIVNNATGIPDTVYNGIFDVIELRTGGTSVVLERSIDFKSVEECVSALIYIKSRSPSAIASGNSYIVSNPKSVLDGFVLNRDNLVIIPFIVQDNTHGSMAYQDYDNVLISGGSVAVDRLYTSSIRSLESSFAIHIPVEQYFEITSTVPGDQVQDAVFSVDSEGHVSAFQFAQMSDRALKRNIQTIQNPLEIINKLHGKTFEWKDDKKNKRGASYGFIAQEVQETLPEIVSETLSGSLTVDYTKVIPILTEAVKDLYERVAKIQTQEQTQPQHAQTQEQTQPQHAQTQEQTQPQHAQTQEQTQPQQIQAQDRSSVVFPPEAESINRSGTTIYVNPQPTETVVTTNVYTIGRKSTYFVHLSSTNQDSVTMEPLFISVENRQIFSLFTNSGANTLDGVPIEIGDIVLIKNSSDPQYNGIFKISGIQHVSFGRFSKCYRMDDFQTFDVMQHAIAIVSPSGFAGNGKGVQNVGVSFTCVIDALNETTFELNKTPMTFVSFGLNPQLGTMSMQDHTNVNITGGQITTNTFVTSNLFPYENNSTISLHLNGSTINDTFQVRNKDSLEPLFTVDGTGRASALEYYAPSDKNLKKNIQSIQNPLELVHLLQGVTFDWRNNKGDHNYGFIAQDVAKNFPSLVHKRSDGYLAVDYAKVVAILVESVKDLSSKLKHA